MADQIVIISSAHDGYRRGGVRLAKGENIFPADKFTHAQVEQLQSDPLLYCAYHSDGLSVEDFSNTTLLQTQTNQGGDTQGALGDGTLSDGVKLTLEQAFAQLQPDNKDHFTGTGLPQLDALEKLVGHKVTSAERAEAWAAYQSKLAAGNTGGAE